MEQALTAIIQEAWIRPENPDAAPLVEGEDFAADVRSEGSRNARTSFESRFITPAADVSGLRGGAGAHSAGVPLAMMIVGAE
jgi:hypothetical protein